MNSFSVARAGFPAADQSLARARVQNKPTRRSRILHRRNLSSLLAHRVRACACGPLERTGVAYATLMQVKNSTGEDVREGVRVSAASEQDLPGSKGVANFALKCVIDT